MLNQEVEIFDTFQDNRKLYGGALTLDWVQGDIYGTSITALRGLHYDSSGSDFSSENLLFRVSTTTSAN